MHGNNWFSVDVIIERANKSGFPIRQIARVTSLRKVTEAERANYQAEYELVYALYEKGQKAQ